jgi:hypothetical protein
MAYSDTIPKTMFKNIEILIPNLRQDGMVKISFDITVPLES